MTSKAWGGSAEITNSARWKKQLTEPTLTKRLCLRLSQRALIVVLGCVLCRRKAALDVRDVFRSRGITCEAVTGDTPKEERRRILEDFKAYRTQCVTNNSVLTTGFNHKGVDLIAFMRPTLSLSLYVQMAGRGTRPLYKAGASLDTVEERLSAIAAGPKRNCLVLTSPSSLIGTALSTWLSRKPKRRQRRAANQDLPNSTRCEWHSRLR